MNTRSIGQKLSHRGAREASVGNGMGEPDQFTSHFFGLHL